MKSSELTPILKDAITDGMPIYIEGQPGIGKTEIIEQVNKTCIFDDGKSFDTLVLHPVLCDPTEFKGLPSKNGNAATFLPFGNLNRMVNADRPLTAFFDDMSQASNSVQAAMMQLWLKREADGVPISKHVRFVGAGNGKKDGAAVTGLLAPMRDRIAGKFTLEADLNDWSKWAINNNVELVIIAFLKMFPHLFNTFDEPKAKSMDKFATPRTYAKFLNYWVKKGYNSSEVFEGCIGKGTGVTFKGFYDIYTKVGLIIDKIFKSGDKVDMPVPPENPEFAQYAFAISAALAGRCSVVNIDNCSAFIEKLGQTSDDHRAFFWTSAIGRSDEIANSAAGNKYMIAHAEDFQ